MSYPVISVEHLSKAYRLGQIGTGTLTYDMKLWWAKMRGKSNYGSRRWQFINITIQPGA